MTVFNVLTAGTTDALAGSAWRLRVRTDETATPTVVVTLPDGSTSAPVFAVDTAGWGGYSATACGSVWLASVTLTTPGRYVAVVSGTYDTVPLIAYAANVTATADLPSVPDLDMWMGGAGAHSYGEDEMADALAAQTVAQRRVCRVPAAYPADLREALLRRAARTLHMRRQLTELPRSEADFGLPPLVPPGRDQEIRKLEAPWPKLPMG